VTHLFLGCEGVETVEKQEHAFTSIIHAKVKQEDPGSSSSRNYLVVLGLRSPDGCDYILGGIAAFIGILQACSPVFDPRDLSRVGVAIRHMSERNGGNRRMFGATCARGRSALKSNSRFNTIATPQGTVRTHVLPVGRTLDLMVVIAVQSANTPPQEMRSAGASVLSHR